MAFKMKAGKEGPMKKNFPKEFAKKAIAGAIIGGAVKSIKGKGTGYIPKNTPQTNIKAVIYLNQKVEQIIYLNLNDINIQSQNHQ